ncbi:MULTISPECIES: UDP-4-amino-4,6-dideoxy-N-acetyl-beta-L-altrosamine transaminase [unclassified Shewanella]|uniref:UDP-4-amino-4, 6-dideoxy-N-acetyl-beta-L-altrosamine transaminase n=1 Tax=unclassified Shewanella TaxID=196818 RepID=UPI0021DAB6FD|nr:MULTISPECIES: UDP-4-amino-4,6-dideoxy-N-acetyl-beta-L-altrosamine transaminase [unclassified Shewanella]MCU8001548.1 UDP-4-amino-4,6-dideoxy-N-acetyl-beta-L-altrosamine transaminase [Shewanella sp. SM96]MCU8059933.1 UDP-4-amino-4,6-dideoxy-N-acetyl-beta-L-altrosamine transaminase [Shewanella sp. SM55]
MIPYGRHDINQDDIDAVLAVLKSDYLTQGPVVPVFEQAVALAVGAKYSVAVNSATSALHIACLALGVERGDLVWTSPITFVASANSALYCGAEVDFVDVAPYTGNMCPKALATKLLLAAEVGTLPKVVIPVHLCGHSCDMQAISALADEYGFKVIEDASHGIGGSYQGHKLGSCEYSDITVFSFHPVKIITSAEGGMAMTNCAELASKMALYRSHGITKVPEMMLRPDEGDWYYEQHLLGFNYRMTDLHAALGLSQMSRLDNFVTKRNQLADIYEQELAGLRLNVVDPIPDSISARHLYMVRLQHADQRRIVFDTMRRNDIQVHVHYFPVHLQPFYISLGFQTGDFPNAERFYEEILTLPLYPTLDRSELQYIVATLFTCIS